MSDELVRYEVDGHGVALLTFDRPERNNAWSRPMERRYFELLDRAKLDADVRAIVVTGAGKTFCPGLDVAQLREEAKGAGPDFSGRRPQSVPLGIPKPIIAAINGACAGIGLVVAAYCDLRFAARGAKLTTAFARRGLTAEHGLSVLLPRLVGLERALDLLLTGRVVLAEEAKELGLVSRVCEPEVLVDEAMALAREMAQHCSPMSMGVIKRQVYGDANLDVDEARQRALRIAEEWASHPDFAEGVASYTERRLPEFAPLTTDVVLR